MSSYLHTFIEYDGKFVLNTKRVDVSHDTSYLAHCGFVRDVLSRQSAFDYYDNLGSYVRTNGIPRDIDQITLDKVREAAIEAYTMFSFDKKEIPPEDKINEIIKREFFYLNFTDLDTLQNLIMQKLQSTIEKKCNKVASNSIVSEIRDIKRHLDICTPVCVDDEDEDYSLEYYDEEIDDLVYMYGAFRSFESEVEAYVQHNLHIEYPIKDKIRLICFVA